MEIELFVLFLSHQTNSNTNNLKIDKMKTSIITTTLKKSIWLHRYNEECLDPDYARQEFELKEGETCYVKIKTYDDGRTYFTYFSTGKGIS